MTDNPDPERNLADELRELGNNLAGLMRSAWESPEAQKLQQEMASGFSELTNVLKREADSAVNSPAGQKFRSDVQDIGQKVANGEAQEKVRQEVIGALHAANKGLENLIQKLSSQSSNNPPPGSESPTQEN